METQPTRPAMPVPVPQQGTSQLLLVTQLYPSQLTFALHECEDVSGLSAALLWPVWTLAQEWLNACVNRVTVEADVKGGATFAAFHPNPNPYCPLLNIQYYIYVYIHM